MIHKYWLRIGFILLMVIGNFYCANAQLRINELLAANISANFNAAYNYTDWIELYNASYNSINLTNYTLSNDPSDPQKFRIWSEIIIEPGEYFIISLDKRNYIYEVYVHTNFALDTDGDFIGLYGPSGAVVDSLHFGKQTRDVSYGRLPDNPELWGYFGTPTPGSSNNTEWSFGRETAGKVQFSVNPGYYQGPVTVALSSTGIADKIVYTVNGDYPKEDAEEYYDSITVTESTVIRARCLADSLFPGEVTCATYFIDITPPNLPVVSLATDIGNFYNATYGFYCDGTNGVTTDFSEYPVNWARDWERPLNFEFFSRDGQEHINQLIGSQVFGGSSRALALRSLAIYAREDYGSNKLEYPFFSDKNNSVYKTLVLRNSGSDGFASLLRDGFMQTLIKDRMDIDYMAYQPVLVFLNGEYFGLMNLREKMNEHYLENNHGVNPDSIDIIEKLDNVVMGTDYYWQSLLTYIREHDLADSMAFTEVKNRLDVNEYMNYYITNIYYENEDWPQANVKFWRERKDTAQWRAMLFDTDFGFGLFHQSGNTLTWALRDPHPSTEIIVALMKNESFKNEFIQRFAAHINTTFDPDRVLPILDSLAINIQEHIPRQVEIWDLPFYTEYWEYHIWDIMENFAITEPDRVRGWIQNFFEISGTYTLSIDIDSAEAGFVKVCEVESGSGYNGIHFNEVPVRLTAVPKFGYKFMGWTGDTVSSESEIVVCYSANASLVAHFSLADSVTGIYINEFVADNESGIVDDHGQHEDWIELYNSNDYAVDLAGLYFTDSAEYLTKYRIPLYDPRHTTIGPGGYLILWADNDSEQGSCHLPFKLRKEGETIILSQVYNNHTIIIDSVSYSRHFTDASYGRNENHPEQWEYMYPSPGYKNKEVRIDNIFINEFMASNRTVFCDSAFEYDDWIEIYNDNDFPVDIGGMFITDGFDDRIKCRIPVSSAGTTTIGPKDFMVLWADDTEAQGLLHLNFKLNAESEQIGLVQPNGFDIMDSVSFSNVIDDAPIGRNVDGYGIFGYLLASPGETNVQPVFEGLYINECMASNRSIIMDDHGEYDDWIEIYNSNNYPVNTGGLFLSDQINNTLLCRIPTYSPGLTTIPPKGYMVFWADDSTDQGVRHLSFKLNTGGEPIVLAQTNGRDFIDSLRFGRMHANVAFGRKYDGSPVLCYLKPTPEETNLFNEYDGIRINEIQATEQALYKDEYNEYDDWIELYNSNSYPVDVAGMFISDSLDDPMKSFVAFGDSTLTVIPPYGLLVLFADNQPEQGILHLDFKMSGKGEQLGFFGNDGISVIDSMHFPNQYSNFSYSKFSENSWIIVPPTPASENVAPVFNNIAINEIMTDNNNWVQDEYGEYDDWIELINNSNTEVNIAGLYLSDNFSNPSKFRIPSNALNETIIRAHGYKIIWIDDNTDQGTLHASFNLNRSGEQIGLYNYNYQVPVDQVSFPEQPENFSYGKPVGYNSWFAIPPSPLAPNILPDLSELYINEIMSSNSHTVADNFGEYDDWFELYNGGDHALNVAGLFVSDSIGDRLPFRISSEFPDSTYINPGEFLLIWADDSTEQGILHTNFKLRSEGEQLVVYSYDTESIIDTVCFARVPEDISFGRVFDGSSELADLSLPTPGKSNNMTSVKQEINIPGDEMLQVFPNPATDNVIFRIKLIRNSGITIKVYNCTGELVAIPLSAYYAGGTHDISWDLANGDGLALNSGLYLYRVETGSEILTGKLIINSR